jgi:predicted DNA-binding transcriptional regulator YafY
MAKSKRPQDQPRTKVRIAKRRARVLQLLVEGKNSCSASKILKAEGFGKGSSQPVVYRDIQALQQQFADRIPVEREEAYQELKQLKQFVKAAEDMTSSDVVTGLLAVHDRLARLCGLDAPTKSVSATVTANAGGPPEAFEFLRHAHGLSEEQLAEVYVFMDQLPRKPLVIDASYFPEPEPAGEEEVK